MQSKNPGMLGEQEKGALPPATKGPMERSPSYAALRTASSSVVRIVLRSWTEDCLWKVPCSNTNALGELGGHTWAETSDLFPALSAKPLSNCHLPCTHPPLGL